MMTYRILLTTPNGAWSKMDTQNPASGVGWGKGNRRVWRRDLHAPDIVPPFPRYLFLPHIASGALLPFTGPIGSDG